MLVQVKGDRVANITVFRKPYVRDALPAVLYWIGNAFAFWAFYTFIPLYLVKVRLIWTPVELTWLATYQIWAVVILRHAGLDAHGWLVLAVGLVIASLSAFVAIWSLLRILERFSAWPFAVYRKFIGAVLLAGVATGWLG